MYSRHLQAILAGLFLLLLCGQSIGEKAPRRPVKEAKFAADEKPAPTLADEDLLKKNKVPTDGPGLLEHLRKRTLGPDGEARLKKLVKELGDDDFETRENATQQLIALGLRARLAVRAAAKDPDLEVRKRSAVILEQIDKGTENALRISAAAVRVLTKRAPPGALAALFAYLPSAEDESIAEEVRLAVEVLAMRDGKVDPILVAGLKDKSALKRAAAAIILCRVKAVAHLPQVRKLLNDPEVVVRFPVALALAAAREKDAVGALIDGMDRLGAKELGRVEDLLYRLAEGHPPALPTGTGEVDRRQAREAWQGWWKANRARIDGDRMAEAARTLGFTTIVLLDQGLVLELDGSNRPRWQFNGLQKPLDVQRLPGERVLVAEYEGNRVTERNTKGEVLWEKKVSGPLAAERLANGNTFIATREGVIVVDKTGKEVSSYHRPFGEQIMRARKLANGDVVLIAQLGVARCVRVDKMGRELKSFGVEVATSGGRIDVLPNGHVLVPELGNDRVVERDADGKPVREVKVIQPIAATYLPNGHWLVTSMFQKRAIEFDRSGKEVWEYKRETRVTRAVRP